MINWQIEFVDGRSRERLIIMIPWWLPKQDQMVGHNSFNQKSSIDMMSSSQSLFEVEVESHGTIDVAKTHGKLVGWLAWELFTTTKPINLPSTTSMKHNSTILDWIGYHIYRSNEHNPKTTHLMRTFDNYYTL